MILTGIIGLCLVAVFWVLLYFYFMRRTDRFMENWEKQIKEKAEKARLESLQSLEEAARAIETSVKGVESLKEAAAAIKTSRKAMEEYASERGFIPKPVAEETATPKQITEPELEWIPSTTPSFQFAPYETRKRKDWEQWEPSRQLISSCT
jgi:biopolymer transport protein ExbB/TolQ